jgi:DNA-binding LytR/AlgR family response regulator
VNSIATGCAGMKQKKIRCIVIDEDSHSLDLTVNYIGRVSELLVVGHYLTAVDALLGLIEVKPEIVFLNIDTTSLGGLTFVKLLPQVDRPAVIVITSSTSHAIECFEQRVVDYLVLPFTFERFVRAVERILNGSISAKDISISQNPLRVITSDGKKMDQPTETLIVKERKKSTSISFREIVLVEGMKDYLKIHRREIVSVIHMTMGSITKILPSDAFLRVNKSYIIQKSAIVEIYGNLITLSSGKKVPIGATYRKSVFNSFKNIII